MASTWHNPSTYPDSDPQQRLSQSDLGHHPTYPPPQQYPPPPSSRDGPGYPPDPAYSRQGSVSAPTRSPAESQPPRYPPHPSSSGNPHEQPYYTQSGGQDYHRPPYGPPEPQPNGTHHPLHVQTAPEMMPGQPGGPPPHHPYGPPPPHSATLPPTPGGYYYPYDSAQQRRKPVRAAQACDSCRQRKAKCDEGRPECQHCKDNGLKCSYREIPPQKSEKQVMQITERLEGLSENVSLLIANQKAQESQIQKLIDLVGQKSEDGPRPSSIKREDSQIHLARPTIDPSQHGADARDDDDDANRFAMPLKHTTAVHHLFDWPSIKALLPRNQSNSYVMDLEVSRGLLRFYGCGEGEDKGDGHEGAPSPAGSISSDGRRMDEETSSASPYGVWGNGQLPTPQASTDNHTAREHPGGLSPRGGLMLDAQAVDTYFRSYMDNMHILHPFLEPKVLRQMVHTFKKKYSWDFGPKHTIVGSKRKREATESPTPTDAEDMGPNQSRIAGRTNNSAVNSANIEHSVTNAIVLLVMALGRVCAYRQPLPGPASTSAMHTSTPHSMHWTLSDLPFPKSAPTSPFSNQLHLNGNNTMAVSSPSNPQGKNMDVIPGLSYYAVAADILGELPGGVDVSHIQANLLAGLYMGQQARLLPSHYYISVACRACQILIESTDYKRQNMRPARRNLINFAFWSCLQLESDILAEVDLPPSGITRYESTQHREMPTGLTLDRIPESGVQEDILRFYSYQIQLRRTMNEVHSQLYKQKDPQKDPEKETKKPNFSLLEVLNKNIDSWRTMLNDWDWDDDDHQSESINVARMRAKYYGAMYITHRPALYHALRTVAPPPTPGSKYSDSPEPGVTFPSPVQHGYSPSTFGRRNSEMGPPGRSTVVKLDEEIINASKKCVEAAIRSTTAFDKVPRRLIITNIFGTAHAQFGNVLVLSATYTSPSSELSSLVSEKTLRELFDRTIKILLEHESISPVLKQDARILQHVRSSVFPNSYPSTNMTSSFSSR